MHFSLVAAARARLRRRRRGFLQGQDRLSRHRLQRRRRLRPLWRGCWRAYMGKHIPGNPTVVPQNMTGAGSLKAANFLYSVAPKDGSRDRHVLAQPAASRRCCDKARASTARKFTWLGSVTNEVSLCVTWHDVAGQDLERFPGRSRRRFGGEGAGSDPDIFALLYKNVFGAKVKLVDRLSRHQRDHARDGARRGRRAVRLVLEHAQDPPSRIGSSDKKINILVQAGAQEAAGAARRAARRSI